MEIGWRLKEAKDLLTCGKWSKWLEELVSCSQSSPKKPMCIFDALSRTGVSAYSRT
ncbi:DUF3102 domain-containing protein [Desulfosporosinus sp. SB140]|uniref:DUF3102 domain-containing protein n=1 Tax=Desulfosporosinus paludis TaxID=3115649 RepID=UPI00388F597E